MTREDNLRGQARDARARWLFLAGVIMLVQAVALLWMGRVVICKCGTVKLWHGIVKSSENSQHLTDWYTFSHVVHGLIFYAVLTYLLPRASWAAKLAAAVALEAGWEIIENTEMVINRYRTATISLDYFGDSVVNSLMDTVAMMVGFGAALLLPVGASIALGIGFEIFMAVMIRDNLTLNILMLVWPMDAVARWQGGG
ncbi:MAG TPA: DUF2585 domain-containing protein [Hyphomicrobiaceae bacterium]|nr:DUF2585 domain-containing protein [Hyphomicrobiaceae bacterium]